MFSVTIQFQNLSDLKSKVAQLFAETTANAVNLDAVHADIGESLKDNPQMSMDIESAVTDAMTEDISRPKSEKYKRKGKKVKIDVKLAPGETFVDESEVKPAAATEITKESVHQALQQVNVAAGLPKARELLEKFGIPRISELPPAKYADFVAKCNEVIESVM